MKVLIAILTILCAVQADAQMFSLPKSYMPVGLNVGGGGDGLVVGGEVSFVFFGGSIGFGLFGDSLKTKKGNRMFGGPEVFFGTDSDIIIGLEAGAATNTNTSKSGFMSGLFLVMENPVIPYVRYFNLAGKSTVEAGVLLKLPIPLGR